MIGFLAVNLAALWAATVWAALLPIRLPRLLPATVLLIHILLLAAAMIVLGEVGQLHRTGLLAAAGAMAAAAGAVAIARRGRVLSAAARWRVRAARTAGGLGGRRATLLVAVVAAMSLWIGLVGVNAGAMVTDVGSYHLPPILHWLNAGRFERVDWIDPRCHWPQGHGLLMGVAMISVGRLHAAALAGLYWLALLFAATWAAARQMGLSLRTSAWAVLAVAAVPVVWVQSASFLNDIGVAALAVGMIACAGGRRVTGRETLLMLAMLAMAASVKPTGIMVGGPVAVLGLVRWARGRPRWPARAAARGRAAAAALLVVAAGVGAFWYARTAAGQPDGNPLYPASLRIAGRTVFEGHPIYRDDHGAMRLSYLREGLAELFWNIGWDRHGPPTPQTISGSGMGALAMGLGWAAMLGLGIGDRRSRPTVLAVALTVLALGLSVKPDAWYGRFYAGVAVMLAVAAVGLCARMPPGVPRLTWRVLVVAAGAWSAFDGLRATTEPALLSRWLAQPAAAIPMARRVHPQYADQLAACNRLAGGQPIAVVEAGVECSPVAPLYDTDLHRRVVMLGEVDARDAVAACRRLGIRWLCFLCAEGFRARLPDLSGEAGVRRVSEGLYEIE